MNINQLRYFVTAAENRSFSKAASKHFISQTAVTQQIQALEESLGVTLFDRSTRPIKVTPAGNLFLVDAKAILERVNYSINRVQEASVGFVGNLRIGYTKGYERSKLSNTLRAFHDKYPNVLISCYRCDTDTLATGLQNNEFDIIFTWDSTELSKDRSIAAHVIERSPLVVALYNSHPFSGRTFLKRSELRSEDILFMTHSRDADSIGDRHFYELYYKAGYKPNITFRSNDMESILMMVAAGEGISVLPGYVTEKLDNADNILFIPLVGDEENVEIIAAWINEEKNPVLLRFAEFLEPSFLT